jgi:hypothetical protein
MILSAHQLNFLPYPGLLAKINLSDIFIYLTKVQFEKKSWQSRNQIINQNQSLLLSIPIINKDNIQNICEVKLDNSKDWKKKHFKTISINYAKSKYFKKYILFFEILYSTKWESLEDINIHILKYLVKELNISTKILSDKDFNLKKKKNELLLEMCNETKCKTYLSNKGSEEYVDLEKFKKHKINHYFINYHSEPYYQTSASFIPNLSIFDMLFFCGQKKTEKIIKNKNNVKFSKNFKKL